ncbi:MAG TPA: M20/M25/M40 family metallo-hydrolase [Candidatus Acidoferrum sp.]|nr:M20/M25/M40 family metallo-hydrolase [Candidatus Acidoferrum sp.]
MRKHATVLALAIAVLAVLPLAAQAPSEADLSAIHLIKDIGFNHSQVMDTMSYLTDVYGPRLTNSPDMREAANWTMGKMKEWQLSNVHTEPWMFGRGWSNERTNVQVIAPHPFPLIAYAKAWTPGTNGAVTADAVYAPITKDEDFDKYRGQLKGKFVLTDPIPENPERFEPQTHRYTDAELAELASQPVPAGRPDLEQRIAQFRARRDFLLKVQKFLVEEGVAVWVEPSRGDDGTVFVQQGGGRDKEKDPPAPCRIAVASENYGRIVRMLEKKVPVTMLADIQNKFYDDDLNSFNIVGEIPGSERSKADEVVMLGAHFDSWQSGTGATDNGAGSAVMLEAMRILKESHLKMHRTVRIALWTGEEQGLLGSQAYVKQHFGDPHAEDPNTHLIKILPEQAKLDAYFNVDNGSGKIRGVYLQGNEMVAPIFSAWMEPFHDLGMTTLTIRNTGGTDHLSFDAVGLPGFQFIQDPLDYETRTHHSNQDVYERIQEPDMKQMAVVVASFVYLTANRDEMLPRKPLPKATPQRIF